VEGRKAIAAKIKSPDIMALPNVILLIIQPEIGIIRMAPNGIPKRTNPKSASDSERLLLMSGIRVTQLPKRKLLNAKTRPTVRLSLLLKKDVKWLNILKCMTNCIYKIGI
jgi:hypothetical protein